MIAPPGEDEVASGVMPRPSENIFARIIRNPRAPGRPVRERLCAELLCSLLMNCETLRLAVLKWLGSKLHESSNSLERLDQFDWRFSTEQSIGSKRDDLRIEGFEISEPQETRRVLWTVEIKVHAPFHGSTDQSIDDHLGSKEIVSQLFNYDDWLDKQEADCRAGFVLAVRDATSEVESLQRESSRRLHFQWPSTTWTGLAQEIRGLLEEEALPLDERFLARHFYGFIRRHLWSVLEMADKTLNFDHVALLRALSVMGAECEAVVNELVSGLQQQLSAPELDLKEVGQQKLLYQASRRSAAFGKICGEGNANNVWLYVGIRPDLVMLWIESPRSHPDKSRFREACRAVLPKLNAETPGWQACTGNERDLDIRTPLEKLLAAEDQTKALDQFVEAALRAILDCRVLDIYRSPKT